MERLAHIASGAPAQDSISPLVTYNVPAVELFRNQLQSQTFDPSANNSTNKRDANARVPPNESMKNSVNAVIQRKSSRNRIWPTTVLDTAMASGSAMELLLATAAQLA
jgi:hypothetical protein